MSRKIGRRRLLHVNVTAHPTAARTVQQFREIRAEPHPYRFALHDRSSETTGSRATMRSCRKAQAEAVRLRLCYFVPFC